MQPFEVDVVFPHNDKYMRMQNWIFPFVLAVQNFPTSTAGNLSWVWRWNIGMWMLQPDGTPQRRWNQARRRKLRDAPRRVGCGPDLYHRCQQLHHVAF